MSSDLLLENAREQLLGVRQPRPGVAGAGEDEAPDLVGPVVVEGCRRLSW